MALTKISAAWDYDVHGKLVLLLSKKRGKIHMNEVGDFLRLSSGGVFQGNWVIFVRAGEQTCEGSGWPLKEEPQGDTWELYQVDTGELCPICNHAIPDWQWCPACGESLNGKGPSKEQALENAEKVLSAMKRESLHVINSSDNEQTKKAWYYSHLGSLDFARQIGLISEKRRLELYKEFDQQIE